MKNTKGKIIIIRYVGVYKILAYHHLLLSLLLTMRDCRCLNMQPDELADRIVEVHDRKMPYNQHVVALEEDIEK